MATTLGRPPWSSAVRCASVAGRFVQRDVLRLGGRALLGVWRLDLGDREEVVPILDAKDVTGMASAEEDQPRDEAAAKIEELLAGETIAASTGLGELEEVQVSVTTPVDDVVAAVLEDLRLQALAGDAVREDVGHDATLRVNLFPE